MDTVAIQSRRIVSGMRPTGQLHLGHYHGVLKNWIKLQHEFDCFFFVADWHALTTHYEDSSIIENSVWEMVIDWLAAGIEPSTASLFLQSKVPEHAELHLLLSMMTPLSWLERVPTYKDQQEKLKEKKHTKNSRKIRTFFRFRIFRGKFFVIFGREKSCFFSELRIFLDIVSM